MDKFIHIIGGPGSGKSFAASKISKLLNIKCYDLDELFWNNDAKTYGKKEPEIKRDSALRDILKKDSWIIEGAYYSWLYDSFNKADLIIVLKPKAIIRDLRIIRRFILRKSKLIHSKKKETFKELINLINWNHSYDKVNYENIAEFLSSFANKIKYFEKADEAIKYVSCKTCPLRRS